MNHQKITLNGDEVISVDSKNNILIHHHTYRVKELLDAIGNKIDRDKKEKGCLKGTPCKMLAPNQPWKKGKVKISIEFIPDEIESSLDNVRKEI